MGTQVQIAGALGISQQAIHRWVRENRVPLERAYQLSYLYNIPLSALLPYTVVAAYHRKSKS